MNTSFFKVVHSKIVINDAMYVVEPFATYLREDDSLDKMKSVLAFSYAYYMGTSAKDNPLKDVPFRRRLEETQLLLDPMGGVIDFRKEMKGLQPLVDITKKFYGGTIQEFKDSLQEALDTTGAYLRVERVVMGSALGWNKHYEKWRKGLAQLADGDDTDRDDVIEFAFALIDEVELVVREYNDMAYSDKRVELISKIFKDADRMVSNYASIGDIAQGELMQNRSRGDVELGIDEIR